ncbi:3-deoxy-D-manno-octulosonic acid transferase [Caulobacter flavus]|uniref:3-deoxy-D-manno-octulosonic acid transferase n=1 Tax=Caulobacter flavus TaxID=1679497 RepID=A0A2N5D7C9_9CAUL|nr:3-deoxy-D-manno-octulosonic acid transferase [Caulobacter flavus]AYV45523.1 3-deoxy-D-manno-octulosonic acid transferase [Caulobacter flavus]PLR21969.1 3-deoxy-D-manno-octulosonic acid transferase [Caulobacter flavus]
MSLPFSLALYRAATTVLTPIAPALLRKRAERGKEDPTRLDERLGKPAIPRPPGVLVWLHGASVGESLSILPLVERLRAERPDAAVLVTSGTVTSAELLARRLPPGAIHQYLPVDTPGGAARFLDHWRPDLAVFVESELWPNLLLGAKARGTRLALVSAKLSDKSYRSWRTRPLAAAWLFAGFDLILAQDGRAADRFASLGGTVAGEADLKFGSPPLPVDEAEYAPLRFQLTDRPLLLAASTHPGEDEIVLDAVAGFHLAPRLVIVPRHPARGETILEMARERGLDAVRRSQAPGAVAEVIVADTLGEMGLWYRLADLAVVCGSLVAGIGGHNPLEPARLDCPIVSGPHVENWLTAYGDLAAAEGVAYAEGSVLGHRLSDLFETPDRLKAQAARARAFVEARDAAARQGLSRILELVPPTPAPEVAA